VHKNSSFEARIIIGNHTSHNLRVVLEPSNQFSGNDVLLNFSRSFINLENLGISHQFLYWVFRVEAVSSKDLNHMQNILSQLEQRFEFISQ